MKTQLAVFIAMVSQLSVLLSRVQISSAALEFDSATSSCETLLEEAIHRIAQLESKNDALTQNCECIGGSMSSATTTISDLDEDLNISKHLYVYFSFHPIQIPNRSLVLRLLWNNTSTDSSINLCVGFPSLRSPWLDWWRIPCIWVYVASLSA